MTHTPKCCAKVLQGCCYQTLKKPNLNPNSMKNYRQSVSNLPYISKFSEHVLSEQLITYLDENHLLDKFQSACQAGFSTETAVLWVMNDMLCNMTGGKVVLQTLLGLSAALTPSTMACCYSDEVEHDVKGPVPAWFCSYLAKHYQYVKVNLEVSANTTYKAAVMIFLNIVQRCFWAREHAASTCTLQLSFVVNVNTQILVWPNLFDGLITDNHQQVHTNWIGIKYHFFRGFLFCFLMFSSRKLSVHHSVNWFTPEKYVSMLLWANSRLRIAESSANMTVKFPEVVGVQLCE